MSESDDSANTRPISVAELLARNGTIGAPPVGGRRRRRRGNADAISVSELTGEIPIIRDEPAEEEAVIEEVEDPEAEASAETVVIYSQAEEPAATVIVDDDVTEEEAVTEDEAVEDAVADEEVAEETVDEETVVEEAVDEEAVDEEKPPLSEEPTPQPTAGPELSEYPRPLRAPSGAEQMAPDPVDESVDIDELLAEHEQDTENLRSYLEASSGALFSGETIADDIARRGVGGADTVVKQAATTPVKNKPEPEAVGGGGLRYALAAVLQSVLAVAFGAGLFLAFDQLWRWNTIVALVLSVLVILGLVIAVRVVRKTEDIASTLIAVAVGALVTLGPLALLQST